MSYIGHFFRRAMAKLTDDKDELNDLKEERRSEKLEAKKEKQLRDEEEAKAKAEADQKKAEEKAIKLEEEAAASGDSISSVCFADPVRLGTDNFFSTDVFNEYYTKVMPYVKTPGKSDYIFATLDEAKAKCQKSSAMFSSKCTGIISYANTNGATQYLVYDGDPTLVETVKPRTQAAKFAATNPQFFATYECVDEEKAQEGNVLCFGSPIQLNTTNFFTDDAYNAFLKVISKTANGQLGTYQFKTLAAAKEKSQTMPNCKGILVGKDPVGDSTFTLYTGDPKLVNTLKDKSPAFKFASQNPQFIPTAPCENIADAEERKTFNVKRLFKRAFGVTLKILHVFLFIALGVFGASLATNLNVYRGWPYRLLYAIYGFLFFFIVIPYVLLWRWFYLKKRPRFYALIPLIGSPIENAMLANLLSWFTFEPDDEMAFLDGCRA